MKRLNFNQQFRLQNEHKIKRDLEHESQHHATLELKAAGLLCLNKCGVEFSQ